MPLTITKSGVPIESTGLLPTNWISQASAASRGIVFNSEDFRLSPSRTVMLGHKCLHSTRGGRAATPPRRWPSRSRGRFEEAQGTRHSAPCPAAGRWPAQQVSNPSPSRSPLTRPATVAAAVPVVSAFTTRTPLSRASSSMPTVHRHPRIRVGGTGDRRPIGCDCPSPLCEGTQLICSTYGDPPRHRPIPLPRRSSSTPRRRGESAAVRRGASSRRRGGGRAVAGEDLLRPAERRHDHGTYASRCAGRGDPNSPRCGGMPLPDPAPPYRAGRA